MKRICFALVAVMFVVGLASLASAQEPAKAKGIKHGVEVDMSGTMKASEGEYPGYEDYKCSNARHNYQAADFWNDFYGNGSDSIYFDDIKGSPDEEETEKPEMSKLQLITTYDGCELEGFLKGQMMFNVCAACGGWPYNETPDVCHEAFNFKAANIVKKGPFEATANQQAFEKRFKGKTRAEYMGFIVGVKEKDFEYSDYLTEEELAELKDRYGDASSVNYNPRSCNEAIESYNNVPDEAKASCTFDELNCNDFSKGRAMYNVCNLCGGWPKNIKGWKDGIDVCNMVWGIKSGTVLKPVKKVSSGR